jgi:ketosteroid isomerase-like protein
MRQETINKQLLERYVAALRAGDPGALRAFFAADASWTLQAGQLPMAGTWEGREQIIDGFFATAMSQYEPESVQLEVTAMIAEHDHVVVQWTSRASTRDGRPYENGCIGVFTIRDGRIAAVREYMDTLRLGDVFATSTASTNGPCSAPTVSF